MNGMRDKYVAITLALLMLLSLTGCGKAEDAAADPTSQETISAVAETEPLAESYTTEAIATLNIDAATLTLDAGSSKRVAYEEVYFGPIVYHQHPISGSLRI